MAPFPRNIPPVGIGTHKISPGALKKALDIGYRHLDLATAYQNMPLIAEAIRGSLLKREELTLTLKILPQDIDEGIERALEELSTDYLDFVLLHVPYADFSKVSHKILPLMQNGIIHRFGVSNFSEEDLREIKRYSLQPSVNQIEIHPYYYPEDLIKTSKQMGAYPVAYRPLGGGKTNLLQDPVIQEIAKIKGASPGQIAIAWLHALHIPCIVKSESEKHLNENMEACKFKLSNDELSLIQQLADKAQRTCTSWIKNRAGTFL